VRGKTAAATVPGIVAAVLTIVYAATLAPGVTLWDAGEFLAAVHSLGIPHPPGTPLYIVLGSVWAKVLGAMFGFARAVNLLSAVATATGCAVLAACVARWSSSRLAGIAAGLAAGAMLSVWRSATETEVYALSFALALIALALGDRAGRSGRARDAVLALYVLALAVPLHLSALVVAPGVVLFAATDAQGDVHWRRAMTLGGAALLAMALGTTSLTLGIAGVVFVLAGAVTRRDGAGRTSLRVAVALIAVVLLAATPLVVMYFRAQRDPFVNQGNPATIDALLGVVGREQYDVPPLWPRRAPTWLQLANLGQYADWQVAFGLDRWVGASIKRTPFTLLFVALAIAGAAWHRARDRRSFRAFALAFASASIGAVVVLNLRAGPSIGIGVLPADAIHEARERDYFFAIAFALGAAWGGMGAARFGAWIGGVWRTRAAPAGGAATLLVAAAPILLNWRAADRSDAAIPLAERLGTGLLQSSPPNAVLLVAGDNDTYPLWYVQRVRGHRRDVTVVTLPLLPASWYRAELARRHGLVAGSAVASWRGQGETIASVANRALEQGRPLAVAVSVSARQREALGRSWIANGLVYVRRAADSVVPASTVSMRAGGDTLLAVPALSASVFIDTISMRLYAAPPVRQALDPTHAYVSALLSCPTQFLVAARMGRGSVDPRCNFR
jgi:hypothetical protein